MHGAEQQQEQGDEPAGHDERDRAHRVGEGRGRRGVVEQDLGGADHVVGLSVDPASAPAVSETRTGV